MRPVTYDDFEKPLFCKKCAKLLDSKPFKRADAFRYIKTCCTVSDSQYFAWLHEDEAKVLGLPYLEGGCVESELEYVNSFATPGDF
jgi:hypothetical protein